MKASRRSRGARETREMGKKMEKKRKRERRKKKRGLLARTIGSLAGCTRARNYVSRLACGLEKRQQDGRSGGRWESGGMEVRKSESREDGGDIENRKRKMCGRTEDVGEDDNWRILEEWWGAILGGKMALCRC